MKMRESVRASRQKSKVRQLIANWQASLSQILLDNASDPIFFLFTPDPDPDYSSSDWLLRAVPNKYPVVIPGALKVCSAACHILSHVYL